MTGPHQDRIEEVFADALQRPPGRRAAYVKETVADEVLRAEVLSLLEAHETRGRLDSVAQLLGSTDATDSSGIAPILLGRLQKALKGRYLIERELGRGGSLLPIRS